MSNGFRWTCSWCHINEVDKAGHFDKGRMFHFGCWSDYQDWLFNEEVERQIESEEERRNG